MYMYLFAHMRRGRRYCHILNVFFSNARLNFKKLEINRLSVHGPNNSAAIFFISPDPLRRESNVVRNRSKRILLR